MLYKENKFWKSDRLNPIIIASIGLFSQCISFTKFLWDNKEDTVTVIQKYENVKQLRELNEDKISN